MTRGAERKDALLGTAFFFVAARAADRHVKAEFVERLLQRLGLHHLGVQRRAGSDRVDALGQPVLIGVHDKLDPEPRGGRVAKRDHLAKLPGRVDMQQREG